MYDAILAKYKDEVGLNYPERRKRNKLPAKSPKQAKVTSNAPKQQIFFPETVNTLFTMNSLFLFHS
jgi:hypothetical protein